MLASGEYLTPTVFQSFVGIWQGIQVICGGALVSPFHVLTYFFCASQFHAPKYGQAFILAGMKSQPHYINDIKHNHQEDDKILVSLIKVSSFTHSIAVMDHPPYWYSSSCIPVTLFSCKQISYNFFKEKTIALLKFL